MIIGNLSNYTIKETDMQELQINLTGLKNTEMLNTQNYRKYRYIQIYMYNGYLIKILQIPPW